MKMEYEEFMEQCSEKINNGELIYQAIALWIAKKFEVKIPSYPFCDVDSSVYHILNYYIEEVEEDLEEWLNKDNAPLIRSKKELRRIFPEFKFIKNDRDLVETVNKVYNLDLHMSDECIYSLSFDFNSFTPINANEIHQIKQEIQILEKYNYPTDELKEKLKKYDIEPEIMELI